MNQKQLKGFSKCIIKTITIPVILLVVFILTPAAQAQLGTKVSIIGSDSLTNRKGTNSVAWGDWDNDGDLDLAVGNDVSFGGVNQVYENEGGQLGSTPAWESTGDRKGTNSVAWGDWDNDGDLDLAIGNGASGGSVNQVYENEGGQLGSTPAWESTGDSKYTRSVAWGDVDGDGDLDLAIGNDGDVNQVYENEGGRLGSSPTWESIGDSKRTYSVTWGDWDNDGDLDLAVGNNGINQVYENEGGRLGDSPAWESTRDSKKTNSVMWGDVDGDGDLDLAVGNLYNVNQVYENEGGRLGASPAWESIGDSKRTESIAWGDWDGDGDLDLAVGNYGEEVNQVYENEGGQLGASPAWESDDSRLTYSVAWGDWDGDGDLDLAVGNWDDVNQVYENKGGKLGISPAWQSTSDSNRRTYSVAWGDWDGDGDLDLAAGNDDVNQVYENEWGQLGASPTWQSTSDSNRRTYSVAWGDWDGDGDLDLAVGNSNWTDVNQVYENEGGQLGTSPAWEPTGGSGDTYSVAWGDWDGDGDLDLAVGNDEENQVYENEGGQLGTSPAWESDDSRLTYSVAWGDWDGDGDLDLAVGNGDFFGGENQVYENEGGYLGTSPAWQSTKDRKYTYSVAWGDWDGDGDLDLAVGNGGNVNQVYENEGGQLGTSPAWESDDSRLTYSVAWGDWDGDGDLDLAVGNQGNVNQVYENEGGQLGTSPAWESMGDGKDTYSVAWGDWDGDGDLDLAVGNGGYPGEVNQVYENVGGDFSQTLTIVPPKGAGANFYGSSTILSKPTIDIVVSLADPASQPVRMLRAYFSPTGGGQWFPATLVNTQIRNLATSPSGITHTLTWQADDDLIKSDNVIFRIAADQGGAGPFQWPSAWAQTFPFRVEAAEWYTKVISGTQPVEGAAIYQAGQLVTKTVSSSYLTNRAGLGSLENPISGQPLIALKQTKEQTTTRAAHDGWAYRTYLTSLNLDDGGNPQPDTIGNPGQQLITIRPDDSLTLFNIVVSIEWDATEEYIADIEDAFRKASDYLYDVTDGQMAFGQVSIYDNAEHWADADFQFSTKNTVRPYAFVGGIISEDKAHTIRVGRFWRREGGNRGAWNEPDGYRTLIHEFAHYALYLEDEYFVRGVDEDGNLIADQNVSCTDPLIKASSAGDETNASVMYWHYHASEFAGADRWNDNCKATQQHLVNGQSDWETISEHYSGADWTINTPSSRGNVMAGPTKFPTNLLPFPAIAINNTGEVDGEALQVTITDPTGEPIHNALVALYIKRPEGTVAIDQGLSDPAGRIEVYGAQVGDIIQSATFDGALTGSAPVVAGSTTYDLKLFPPDLSRGQAGATSGPPYLTLRPSADGDAVSLKVYGTYAGGTLTAILIPNEGGGSPQSAPLAYSPTDQAHIGQVNFNGVGLGTGKVQISGPALSAIINSDYNLQQLHNDQSTTLFSEDGNFEFHLPVDSLAVTRAYATVMPTGYVPGPLPEAMSVIGSAYEVRLSDLSPELQKDGVVRLHYHPEVMGVYTQTAIFRWQPNLDGSGTWHSLGGIPSDTDNAWAVSARRPGIYALMGVDVTPPAGTIYLPVIVKN